MFYSRFSFLNGEVRLVLHGCLREAPEFLLQSSSKKRVRRFDHLIEPDLFPKKRMRRVLDDSEAGLDVQLFRSSTKFICVRALVVRFTRDEPAGRVLLIEVIQRRREAIRGWLVFLRAAEKLPPDLTAILSLGDFPRALRLQIRLRSHRHGCLNRAAELCIPAFAFKFFCPV